MEDLAAAAGATVVVGAIAAVATFGGAEFVAAGVTAGLIAAAEAVGVELSGTVAAIAGGALSAGSFGALESIGGDVTEQGLGDWVFDRRAFSLAEVGESAAIGGASGGLVGAGIGALAVGPIARTAAGDLSRLRAPGGRIRAALDPPNWGMQGGRFTAGVHELPGARAFQPHELPTAELLASEGRSVHARPEINADGVPNPDALVRSARNDAGTYTEFKNPTRLTDSAVKNDIMVAGKQLEPYGGGDLVVDGRTIGLTRDVGETALRRALGQSRAHGSSLPNTIRIVLADGSSIHYP